MAIARERRTLAVLFAVGVANVVLLLALIGDTTGWRGARDAVYVAVALGFAAAFGVLVFIRDRSPRAVLVITILVVCSYYVIGLPSIGVVLPLLASLVAVTLAGHRYFRSGSGCGLLRGGDVLSPSSGRDRGGNTGL